MLTRQKIILSLLSYSRNPVNPTMLVKLAFLLGQETVLGEDRTYYDFVPYRYGPFSFALYRELEALKRDGYVSSVGGHFGLVPETLVLSNQKVEDLPKRVVDAVKLVTSTYSRVPGEKLLRDVYARYPWYASKSELAGLRPLQSEPPRLSPVATYTIGYEGKSVDGFFAGLLRAGMHAIIDVRANPVSRKYGFAQRSLRDIASKLGIAYTHFPKLGIAGTERSSLTDYESYQRLLDRYEHEMLPKRQAEISRLIQHLLNRPAAILCMEADVTCCHRGRLAKATSKVSNLPIVHLN